MKRRITSAYLLRSVFVAALFAVLLHLLADYFDWNLFSEAGGIVVAKGI